MYQGASRAKHNAVGRRLERRVRQSRHVDHLWPMSGGCLSRANYERYPLLRSWRWRTEAAGRAPGPLGCGRLPEWPERALSQRGEATWPSRLDAGQEWFQALPNVRVEAGPTVLRLAREAHHLPRRFAGQVQCRWASPRTRG
jgi:hypothetical protein